MHVRACHAPSISARRHPSGREPCEFCRGGVELVVLAARLPHFRRRMPIRVRTSGCLFSIIASLLLTLLLNLALRGCS
jgi:hypothetical protein